MFGDKKKTRNARIDTLIGRNTEIAGDVRFKGGLHIDGKVTGNVLADDDPDATVSISQHGTIEGETRVPAVVVNGAIHGDVYASERIELAADARVSGNVYYHLLEMSAGAEVNGKLVHQPGGPKLLELHRPDQETPDQEAGEAEAAQEGSGN